MHMACTKPAPALPQQDDTIDGMRRIPLDISDTMALFLDEMSELTGIDRTNLIRGRIEAWRIEERDRQLGSQYSWTH